MNREKKVAIRAKSKSVLKEIRVVEALNTIGKQTIHWLISARRATREEDSCGVDVVVETSLGFLALQVKSSSDAGRKARREFGRTNRSYIGVVVIKSEDEPEVVLGKALGKLFLLREGKRYYFQDPFRENPYLRYRRYKDAHLRAKK